MRRFPILPALVAIVAVGASATVAAQDTRIRRQDKVVIPQELIVELQRVFREAFGDDMVRDITKEVSRSMADLTKELGRLTERPFVDGRFAERFGEGLAFQDKGNKSNFRFEQTDKQTKTLAIGNAGSLELGNVLGNITVKAGGSRDATVEITRISRGASDADAKLGLERVNVDIVSRDRHASVTAKYPEERRPNYYVSVEMAVTAPAGTRLSVSSVTGNLTISGIKGELSASTTTGNIDISGAAALDTVHTVTGRLTIRDSQTDGPLDLGTMSGRIELSNLKAKRLEVSAVAGTISARDIQAGGAEITTTSGTIEYSGTVVPQGRYEFSAHNGEIRLGLTGGFDFEGSTFNGQIDADPSLGLKSAPSPQRIGGRRQGSLRGTVGNGGAFVEATSFNGRVYVGRSLPDSKR